MVSLPRGEQPIARCEYMATLHAEKAPEGRRVSRLLCEERTGARFVVFERSDEAATGDFEIVLSDPDSDSWIHFAFRQTQENHRRDGEPVDAWRLRRMRQAQDGDGATVRIETNELTFDVLPEHASEGAKKAFREQVWRDINERQPEVAALLQRALAVVVSQLSAHLPPGLLLKSCLADYVMPGSVIRRIIRTVRIECRDQGIAPLDAGPLDEDFESAFGKWASWPDFPRLDG